MKLILLFLIPLLTASYDLSHRRKPRIIGGRDAKLGEVPYQVSLQTIKLRHNFCGGVIINRYYILTCAHCMVEKNISLICAVVEIDSLRQSYSIHFIESSYIHEKYNRSDSWVNDIALVKVKTPFVFSSLVSPVTLPRQDEIVETGATAVVSGYGRLLPYNISRSTTLQIISIKITDQAYCRYVYKNQPNFLVIYDTQICADDTTCQGDSGGPLTIDGKLVGLISWSIGCTYAYYPTVYTRVSSYINWISEHAV